MRKTLKIPRILKINWIRDMSISVVFNNGESRIIEYLRANKETGFIKLTSKDFVGTRRIIES